MTLLYFLGSEHEKLLLLIVSECLLGNDLHVVTYDEKASYRLAQRNESLRSFVHQRDQAKDR